MPTKKKIVQQPIAVRPLFLTITQASEYSGIGETTLRKFIDEGKLEYLAIGNRKLLTADALVDFYHRHKTPAWLAAQQISA
jgi:excisionase family DNA binding protein